MFAAFTKMINVISHTITAGSRRCCPELITDDLFPPQKSHYHFNLLQVQRTERPLIQSLYFVHHKNIQKHSGKQNVGVSHFLKLVFLLSHQVSMLSEDLRVQLSSVDVMFTSGFH